MGILLTIVFMVVVFLSYCIYTAGEMDENGVIHEGKTLKDLFK